MLCNHSRRFKMSNIIPSLKQLFIQKFDIPINKRLVEEVVRWKTLYEMRDTHVEALNSPLLGCAKIHFFAKDQQALFDIFGVEKTEFAKAVNQSSINKEFRVASDIYNLFSIWVIYLIQKSSLSQSMKDEASKAILIMLQIKFFTSLVAHLLPYGAKQETMEATIDGLSDKFDIKHKETSTWKLIMEVRAADILKKDSVHYHSIVSFSPDNKVTYVITDIQTRLRTKLKLVVREYYDAVAKGNTISSTTMTTDDMEGEKIVKELTQSYDNMIATICNKVLNTNQFIRADYIKILTKMIANVRPDMMRTILTLFSSLAMTQYQKHEQEALDKTGKLFVGYQILISNIIQRTYRAAIIDKVNLKSRLAILEKARNLYRSSRISDPIIIQIKDSVSDFVEKSRVSNRDATKSSLKIAFIIYIILLSFDYE